MKEININRIKKYIEEHFTEEISLDDISKIAGYSKYHLNRLFFQKTGQTIYQYIKERRLFEAANQLSRTENKIIDIAFEVGYTSQQSFTFAFKRQFDCTPQAYRKQYHINYEYKKLFYIKNTDKNKMSMFLDRRMAA